VEFLAASLGEKFDVKPNDAARAMNEDLAARAPRLLSA
jgi:hypothetical protein